MILSLSESRGKYSKVKNYYKVKSKGEENDIKIVEDSNTSEIHLAKNDINNQLVNYNLYGLIFFFKRVFLPNGYPQSVSSDYISYQIWDTVQAFSSSITGALATEAVMKGVGVGDETATPLAAALTWLLKSGSGMIGQILFAWFKGSALDYDCKAWRLFADALNDLATFIELIAPMFSSSTTFLVICCSGVARSLVGVAGGSTRAAITQHQARNNNMADVSAKDGSQETLVNLVALICSLIILPLVNKKPIIIWTLFIIFTILHLFANFKAVKSLKLEGLNSSRLLICLDEYLNKSKKIPTIEYANKEECVLLGLKLKDSDVCGFKIKLGISLEEACANLSSTVLDEFIKGSDGKPFLIIPNKQMRITYVVLHENITAINVIEAFTKAILSSYAINYTDSMNLNLTEEWNTILKGLNAQYFNLIENLIETDDWRAKWKTD